MSTSFVRVPPDSTGKRITSEALTEIDYDALTGSFVAGNTVTGASSGATGTVKSVITEGFATNEGRLYLGDVTGTFTNDENLEVAAASQATANIPNGQVDYQTQMNIIVDPDNPEFRQKIDKFGATVNTFTDGSPAFGAFGGMTTLNEVSIRDYKHAYDELPDEYYANTSGTGAISYVGAESSVLYSTGGTASGALAQNTTHYYHPYSPGVGNIIEQTIVLGDSGKTNVRRRWGLFDDDNGMFWELNGTDFRVVVRSNTSGSPVDTVIEQADWSNDSLDGPDGSGQGDEELLDLTKTQIFWIDFQWLGVGRVKFGIFNNLGEKVTAHIVENANRQTKAFMRTANLPLRYEIENTGASASTSELKNICSTVKSQGQISHTMVHHGASRAARLTVLTADGEVPLLSLRPKTTFNTYRNSSHIRLENLSIHNSGADPIFIRIRKGCTCSGGAWVSHAANSTTEQNITATGMSGGHVVWGAWLNSGDTLEGDFGHHQEELDNSFMTYLDADDTTQPELCITGEVIDAGATAAVLPFVSWNEVKL